MTTYSLYYFLHIAGLAIWVGALLVLSVLLLSSKKELHATSILIPVTKVVNRFINPSSFIVLVSGIFMLIQFGDYKPLYIIIMERGGSLIILLSIILLTWQSNKMKKAIAENDGGKLVQTSSRYATYMFSSALLALVIVFFASVKL